MLKLKTPKKIATHANCIRVTAIFCLIFLAGCSGFPLPPSQPLIYDLGPGVVQSSATEQPPLWAPLVLAEVEGTGPADGNTAVQYRLAYADARQLRTYQNARWSQPPAQLVQRSLRMALGQQRAILHPEDAQSTPREGAAVPAVLRVQLEEFSHVFFSPRDSAGLVRLRATLTQPTPTGVRLLGQRVLTVQKPATSADAAGGAYALTEAIAEAAQGVAHWLALEKTGTP